MVMSIAPRAARSVVTGAARFGARQGVAPRALAGVSIPPRYLTTTTKQRLPSTVPRAIGISQSARSSYSTSANNAPLKACPNCGEAQPLESLACPACKTLQPLPSDVDFYKAMDLDFASIPKGGWEVDINALKRAWRLKMALTHPDRMVNRSEKEQQIGAQQSALINRAYETLLNPLPRAHYLLERYNAPEVSESDSLEDPELLMEVMELRERLEEAESEEEAAEVRADNMRLLEATVERLASAFESQPPDLEEAREAAVQLRYWTNIEKAAREWSPGKRVELQH